MHGTRLGSWIRVGPERSASRRERTRLKGGVGRTVHATETLDSVEDELYCVSSAKFEHQLAGALQMQLKR